jgi:hypothetical protein
MKIKNILGAAGMVTAGIVAGTVISMAGTANAADTAGTSTNTVTSSTAPVAPSFGDKGTFNPGGADSIRPDEKAVTGSDADKLKSAAEAKVPGATAFRIETDGDGSAFEVHMKKADGSLVTVKFDKNFNITSVEDGMGAGGPAGGFGGHAPDGDGDGPGAQNFSVTPTPTQTN